MYQRCGAIKFYVHVFFVGMDVHRKRNPVYRCYCNVPRSMFKAQTLDSICPCQSMEFSQPKNIVEQCRLLVCMYCTRKQPSSLHTKPFHSSNAILIFRKINSILVLLNLSKNTESLHPWSSCWYEFVTEMKYIVWSTCKLTCFSTVRVANQPNQ